MNTISNYCLTAWTYFWSGFKTACALATCAFVILFVLCSVLMPIQYPSIWTIGFGSAVVCFVIGWGKAKAPPSFPSFTHID